MVTVFVSIAACAEASFKIGSLKISVTNTSSDECTLAYFAIITGGSTRRDRSGEPQSDRSTKGDDEGEGETRHDTSRR